jgi:alpha-D-xyloside xylohydrolase
VVAANGDSGKRLHNAYAVLYNRCVFEATQRYGNGPPMVWGRSGWTSSQRTPVQWGGDPQADWEGLAASIRGGLSWGMTGVPAYASDVGGFYGDPSAELYLRWIEAGVFFSHFRFHGVGAREPWAFGETAEGIARAWFERRYQLIPYLEAALAEASLTGLPVMRAMALAFPEEPESWGFEHQFLCGPSLLVIPVIEPGGRVVAYLPEGRWHDLWSGESLDGGRSLVLEAPLDRIPVFGRDGHVVRLAPVAQTTAEQGDAIAELWAFGYEGRIELAANAAPPAVRTWECRVVSASTSEVVLKR